MNQSRIYDNRRSFILVLMLFCLSIIQSAHSSEPSYNGKYLSEWLVLALRAQPSSEYAIRKIGTNGIPTLLDMLGATDKNVKQVVAKLQNKELQQTYSHKYASLEDLRSLAVGGFSIIGTNAASAVPQIAKLFHDITFETSFQAARALTKVGSEGFSVLTNALSDSNATFRANAIWVIGEEAPINCKVVTILMISCLKDQNVINRGNAAKYLANKDANLAIPALIPMLDENEFHPLTSAALALSSYGSAAKVAIPKLLSVYTNSIISPDHKMAHDLGIELMWAIKAIDLVAAEKAEAYLVNSSPLNSARSGYTTTLFPDGKELIAGGYVHTTIPVQTSRFIFSAELLDTTNGKWTETGELHTARKAHTATLLKNGKVLIVGGSDSKGCVLSCAELYDPATGKWIETGSLNNARFYHTAVLQRDGKVLITGGHDGRKRIEKSELYDPTTEIWTVVIKKRK